MKYNVKNIERKHNNLLFFYGYQEPNTNVITNKCLSQWYFNDSSFLIDGVRYRTAEQYMMYQKALLFKDHVIAFKIIGTNSPAEAKRLGRLVKNYDEKIWKENRIAIVKNGNLHKFGQNPELSKFLLSTVNKVLVEASPYDKIWGIGIGVENHDIFTPARWKGLNLLGFTLMEVRDELNLILNGKD